MQAGAARLVILAVSQAAAAHELLAFVVPAHELLEVICSRYFVLGSQGLAEYSWEVNGREGRSPSACLRSLNRHLKELSLIAVLDEGDPPLLSVGSLPMQAMVMPAWQQAVSRYQYELISFGWPSSSLHGPLFSVRKQLV